MHALNASPHTHKTVLFLSGKGLDSLASSIIALAKRRELSVMGGQHREVAVWRSLMDECYGVLFESSFKPPQKGQPS